MGFHYLEHRVHLIYTNKVKYLVMHSIVMHFFSEHMYNYLVIWYVKERFVMFSYQIINKCYITTYLFWRSYAAHCLSSNCIYVIAEQLFYAMFNQGAVLEQKVKRKEHYEFQQMWKYGIKLLYHIQYFWQWIQQGN